MIAEASGRDPMLAAMPKLRASAIFLCRNGDHAEDLVQETLLRACANITSFKPGTNMFAWLFTILRNEFYSQYRRGRKRFETIVDNIDGLASKPTQLAHAEHHDLCAALTKLPPEQRRALILVEASGLSYPEAAKMCGCPTGTMKSRVNRARAELAQLLSIEGPEDFEEDPVTNAVIAGGDRRLLHPQQSIPATAMGNAISSLAVIPDLRGPPRPGVIACGSSPSGQLSRPCSQRSRIRSSSSAVIGSVPSHSGRVSIRESFGISIRSGHRAFRHWKDWSGPVSCSMQQPRQEKRNPWRESVQ
jgi:RNA polymerase sigma-70 factor (ECF subfamily)